MRAIATLVEVNFVLDYVFGCVGNKLTGKMEVVLLRKEWISLFSHGTFQHYVFMLSTRFVRTSGNGLSHKTWSHFLFAQHLEAHLLLGLWWISLRCDNFFLNNNNNFFLNAGNWRINLWNCWSSHFARSVRAVIV